MPVIQTNASQFKGQIKRSVSMDCSVWSLMNNSGTWGSQHKSEALNPDLRSAELFPLTPVQNMLQHGFNCEVVNCPIDGNVLQAWVTTTVLAPSRMLFTTLLPVTLQQQLLFGAVGLQ